MVHKIDCGLLGTVHLWASLIQVEVASKLKALNINLQASRAKLSFFVLSLAVYFFIFRAETPSWFSLLVDPWCCYVMYYLHFVFYWNSNNNISSYTFNSSIHFGFQKNNLIFKVLVFKHLKKNLNFDWTNKLLVYVINPTR